MSQSLGQHNAVGLFGTGICIQEEGDAAWPVSGVDRCRGSMDRTDLSDEGLEDAVYNSQAIRRFIFIDLNVDTPPDATTLLKFRRLLETHSLTKAVFDTINGHLAAKGLLLNARLLTRRSPLRQFRRLIFVDESGGNIAVIRRYGRARRGMWVHDSVPKNFGRNVTILGALSCTGLMAVMSVDGTTGTAVFRAYVEQIFDAGRTVA